MTKNTKHLKRYMMPRTWRLPRKEHVWAPKPSPGPHPQKRAIPLVVAIRDILGLVDTSSEAKKNLSSKYVLVDGAPRRNHRFPLGLMDVVYLTKEKKGYRVMLNPRGQIVMRPLEQTEIGWKLVRIMDKTVIKGGKMQLNLHDGRNIVTEETKIRTGDVLKISLPEQKILEIIPMQEESLALLTGGTHIGRICRIKRIEKTQNPTANLVEFHEGFNTIIDHVFMVGRDTSEVGTAEVAL